jgi:FkbM family methyltransferase
VLEVGGALGCLTILVAKIVGSENIKAFEANPQLINDALANFELNGVSPTISNTVLRNRVCWEGVDSTVKFYINKDFWASSLVELNGTVDVAVVDTACLEDEIAEFRANTLVCDIEGGEIELLSLANLRGIDKILMEIHYWAGRERINQMLRKLILDGFSVNFDLSFRSIVTLQRNM